MAFTNAAREDLTTSIRKKQIQERVQRVLAQSSTLHLPFIFCQKNYSIFYPFAISLAAYISSYYVYSFLFFFSPLYCILGIPIAFTQHYTISSGEIQKERIQTKSRF